MAAETKKPWEIEREFSFFGYGFQLVLAYFGTLIGLFIFAIAVGPRADGPVWQILYYPIVLLLAVVLALAVSRLAPTSTIEGRWVWVAPVGLVAFVIAWSLYLDHPSEAGDMFYFGNEGGEAGLGLYFVTLPTWGCCCYSATMFWRRRQREGKGPLPDE
jgi:hypothetical protein